MDCRTFHKRHVAYVDDTLSAVDTADMHAHVAKCASCARHDTKVRRSLLLFRNLPTIEPSLDFNSRLDARLREIGPAAALIPRPADTRRFPWLAAAMVTVATIGTLSIASMEFMAPRTQLALAPVLATRPKPQPPPVANHAIVTSASVGMPVWTTVLTVDEAPMEFVRAEFQQASWTR